MGQGFAELEKEVTKEHQPTHPRPEIFERFSTVIKQESVCVVILPG